MLLNIYFYFFVDTHGYLWISINIKKLYEYPYNGYSMDMSTGTWLIYIQRIRYKKLLLVPYSHC